MKRSAFLALMAAGVGAAACGEDMRLRSDIAIGGAPTRFGEPGDLLSLPNASQLRGWWDASSGITMSPTLLATGTSPPAVTVSGTLTGSEGRALFVQVNNTDSTKFDWNFQDGWALARGVGEMNIPIPQGGTYALAGSDLVLSFPTGTYNNSHVWRGSVQSWASKVGGASMLLDNSSVYAGKGPIIENPRQFNEARPSIRFDSAIGAHGLGNTSGVPALLTGTNTPFHIFVVCQITATNISTLPVALFNFANATSTTGDYLDARWYGPLAVAGPGGVGPQHLIQRRVTGSAAVTAQLLTALSFGPCILDYGYDGTTVKAFLNGQQMFSSAWSSGALALQRFLLGSVKLGAAAVSNVMFGRVQTLAIYNAYQAENDNGAWAVRRALA